MNTETLLIRTLENKVSSQHIVITSIKDTLWHHYGPLKSRDKTQLVDPNPEILLDYSMPVNEMLYNVLVSLGEIIKKTR